MSNHEHDVTTDNLEVIKEERPCSPALSSEITDASATKQCNNCKCIENDENKNLMDPELVQTLLKEKEKRLTEEFEQRLTKELNYMKERAEYILQNEQTRASYMLREAHRERQEKIGALQTQLQCKNLAGLMFVMCTERRKSKLEKMRLIQEYTTYIYALQDILTEAQSLILHLSKGYKTAARVDNEWRDKMKIILKEFQMFIHDYAGGAPESNQYFFNVPELLRTNAPIVDDPTEDPCDAEPEEEEETVEDNDDEPRPWWERTNDDSRPFLVFGDMSEFRPPQRREVLRSVKAAKAAPRKWKEYVFNEMFIKAGCENADVIKDEYMRHVPSAKWECGRLPERGRDRDASKASIISRRTTRVSEDVRGDMGSILKIMTNSLVNQPHPRSTLLGARDSMEIVSTTKLREKHKPSGEQGKVVINLNESHTRRTSFFVHDTNNEISKEFEDVPVPESGLNDSLEVISKHVPDKDHIINYEKVCPVEKCQRLNVDSFIRSLPPYMRESPFTHFEQTYDQYELCSPGGISCDKILSLSTFIEQLEILKQRIQAKKDKLDHEHHEPAVPECPLAEWTPSVEGVGVQTSELSVSLPPCTCGAPNPTPASSDGRLYNVADLIPIKAALDQINTQCLFDERIQFDRFKVLGQDSLTSMGRTKPIQINNCRNRENKAEEITKALRDHPSLLDIFQGNTQC